MKVKNYLQGTFTSMILTFLILSTVQPAVYAQGVTPEHIANMKVVTGSTISDNGNFVAYTLSVPGDPVKENVPNQNHLYLLNTETGESRPYFTSSSAGNVVFRPGKGSITFLSRNTAGSGNALFEIHPGGGEAQIIFSADANIVNYEWSADGNRLAYTVRRAAPKPTTPLSYLPEFYEEDFSRLEAYVKDFRRGGIDPQQINVEGAVHSVNWSPDGSKIAMAVAPTSSVDDMFMKKQVMIADANTRNIIATIDNQGKLAQIEWSPDGTRLALRAGNDLHDPIDGRILIVSATGGTPQIIDAGFLGKYEHIRWTEANTIHFLASESTASTLGKIQPDGQNKEVIFTTPVHHISRFDRASNDVYSLVVSTPLHPAEVFMFNAAQNAIPEKRTDHNPWLAGLKLGKQEVVRYPARDGEFDIEGMLIYPVDYVEGTRVPLITVVHGGPEAHYSNGWLTMYHTPGQMAAAKGYAVFYPNYRGSTGRGIEFIYSSQADLSGKEFDDVVDGVDYLIERGIADANRIGVTGGSYGGYASAWMSTYYSERFAAAVMFIGISNNISKWGTSDIPNELYLVHTRKRLWDNWMDQLQRSPIYYVDRAQTPILIMHGSNDTRVHPAQSMELYRHLKVRKPEVPARLIFYPGEGHGNTRSGSRYDYTLRMLQWFDTYLKTGDATAEMPSVDLHIDKK